MEGTKWSVVCVWGGVLLGCKGFRASGWCSVVFRGISWYSVMAAPPALHGGSALLLRATVVLAWHSSWRTGGKVRFTWGQSNFFWLGGEAGGNQSVWQGEGQYTWWGPRASWELLMKGDGWKRHIILKICRPVCICPRIWGTLSPAVPCTVPFKPVLSVHHGCWKNCFFCFLKSNSELKGRFSYTSRSICQQILLLTHPFIVILSSHLAGGW